MARTPGFRLGVAIHVGDVHGAYDRFVDILGASGLLGDVMTAIYTDRREGLAGPAAVAAPAR